MHAMTVMTALSAKMAPNPATFLQKSPPSSAFNPFAPKPFSTYHTLTKISSTSSKKNAFRVALSCSNNPSSSNLSRGSGFRVLGSHNLRFRQMDFDYFRYRAGSGGGIGNTGGNGGFGGGSDDGNSGESGEDDSDGSNNSLFSWYLMALEIYPVLTKALTSSLLTLVGDLMCQLLIDRVVILDLKRTFLFTLLGFALVGPTLHFWYFYLSKLVTLQGASGASLRLLLDQFLFSPIFIGVFMSLLVTLEGRPSQVVPRLQQEWFPSVLANWQLWIPFQFLNFRFVPQQFQVLVANIVALAWNVILSFKAHKEIVAK